jgi:hypothetical protein
MGSWEIKLLLSKFPLMYLIDTFFCVKMADTN